MLHRERHFRCLQYDSTRSDVYLWNCLMLSNISIYCWQRHLRRQGEWENSLLFFLHGIMGNSALYNITFFLVSLKQRQAIWWENMSYSVRRHNNKKPTVSKEVIYSENGISRIVPYGWFFSFFFFYKG